MWTDWTSCCRAARRAPRRRRPRRRPPPPTTTTYHDDHDHHDTTTTTLPECAVCPFNPPFLVARDARLNNDATIDGSVGVNDQGGSLRLGRRLTMTDGTTATSDGARLAAGASIANARVNNLVLGPNANVRGTTGPAVLPIISPFCSIPADHLRRRGRAGAAGSEPRPARTRDVWPPLGAGRRIDHARAGRLHLLRHQDRPQLEDYDAGPGDPERRRKRHDRHGLRLRTGTGNRPDRGECRRPRSAGEPTARSPRAVFVAPNARISFGRGATLQGCFCADRINTDKRINLVCPPP